MQNPSPEKFLDQSWIEITVKFPNKCLICKKQIKVDQTALWFKGTGIKHIANECTMIGEQHVEDIRRPYCHGWKTIPNWEVNASLASNSVSCYKTRCHICNDVFIKNTFIVWHPEELKGCHKDCKEKPRPPTDKIPSIVSSQWDNGPVIRQSHPTVRIANMSKEEKEWFQQQFETETPEDYKKREG